MCYSFFQINSAVIIVSQKSALDYETNPEYNLQVVAQDNPINLNNNNVQFKTSVPVSSTLTLLANSCQLLCLFPMTQTAHPFRT